MIGWKAWKTSKIWWYDQCLFHILRSCVQSVYPSYLKKCAFYQFYLCAFLCFMLKIWHIKMVISYQNLMIFPSKTVTNWVSSIRARGTWSGSLVVALRRNWSDGIRQLWTAHPPATPSMNLWRNDIDSVYIDYINIHIHIYMYKYIYMCMYNNISLYIIVYPSYICMTFPRYSN